MGKSQLRQKAELASPATKQDSQGQVPEHSNMTRSADEAAERDVRKNKKK